MKAIDISQHSRWGNSIYFTDYKARRIAGHLTPKPEIGDRIKLEMKTEKDRREWRFFAITTLKDFSDPPDQFFCDVKDSGYLIKENGKNLEFHLGEKCPFCRKKFKRDFNNMISHLEKKHKGKLERVA